MRDYHINIFYSDDDPDGQVKIPHLWPGQNPPATGLT